MRDRVITKHDLITYMQSKPGVWFTTCEQLAQYVKPPAVAK
jgi:hypothetical protein